MIAAGAVTCRTPTAWANAVMSRCTHAHVPTCTHARMHACEQAHMHTFMYVHTCTHFTHAHMHTLIHVHTCTHTNAHMLACPLDTCAHTQKTRRHTRSLALPPSVSFVGSFLCVLRDSRDSFLYALIHVSLYVPLYVCLCMYLLV